MRPLGWALSQIRDQQPDDRHGRENRRQNADRQRHGEAADRPGAQPEHDERAGQRRQLAVGDRHEGALKAGIDRRDRRLAGP